MEKIRRVRKTAIRLIFLILMLLLLGCESIDRIDERKLDLEDKRIQTLVMKELETRYDEKFEIRRTLYDKRKYKWKLEVYPKENNIENEIFIVDVKKDPKERIVENYYSMKNYNLTTIYYRPIIKKIFKEKNLYFGGNIGTDIPVYRVKNIKKEMEVKPEKKKVNLFIYIFEDAVSTEVKKEKFIKEVWELFKYLKRQDLKCASIRIKIYDEEFFEDKDIEHILKVSSWFSTWTSEFDVFKYRRKQKYSMWVEEQEYDAINNIEDMKKQLIFMKKNYQK